MEVRILFGATNQGRVTALVCKTNPRHQIAVLAFAVSEFESHLSHKIWDLKPVGRGCSRDEITREDPITGGSNP